ncbi:sigma factor-like helix-turn-helix DNA-binding protein, partial [Nannocystis pusilla]|uniref:RNA polymerase sigma factor n=1 Tax=Nannocystis pusilla TaxID=889268 RepID=UPI003BF0D2DD
MNDPTKAAESNAHGLRDAFHQYFGTVRAAARLFGIPSSVLDDVALQTFVMAHGRGEDLREPAIARARLVTLTRRVAEWYREELPASTVDVPTEFPGADVLTRFLAGLAPQAREVFVLSELGGLRVPEISAELGVGFETARAQVVELVRDFAAATAVAGAEEVLHDLVRVLDPPPVQRDLQLAALDARLAPRALTPEGAEPPHSQWVMPISLRRATSEPLPAAASELAQGTGPVGQAGMIASGAGGSAAPGTGAAGPGGSLLGVAGLSPGGRVAGVAPGGPGEAFARGPGDGQVGEGSAPAAASGASEQMTGGTGGASAQTPSPGLGANAQMTGGTGSALTGAAPGGIGLGASGAAASAEPGASGQMAGGTGGGPAWAPPPAVGASGQMAGGTGGGPAWAPPPAVGASGQMAGGTGGGPAWAPPPA